MSTHRLAQAERIFRAYAENRLAIDFTGGVEGDAAKRVRGPWNKTKPWSNADFAAGLAGRCEYRNPVIVLGASGLVGIDIDGQEGLDRFRRTVGDELPPTVKVRTGKGEHLYFRPPPGLASPASFEFGPNGVTPSSERYFVAPPALHPDGTVYDFEPGLAPWEVAIAELPQWALDAMLEATGTRRTTSARRAGAAIPRGSRNQTLASLAGSMQRRGMSQAAICEALKTENRERCDPPLGEDEVEGIAWSISRYEPEPLGEASPGQPDEPGAPTIGDAAFDHRNDPELDEAAYRGIAGDFLRAAEPETEAHPAALLLHFICFFGIAVGRSPHVEVSASRHGANVSAVIVGRTSSGRKGESQSWARKVFEQADEMFVRENLKSGLSTGEGLLHAVRDRVTRSGKDGGPSEVVDQGVDDKRLLAIEQEFGKVLRVAGRDGNTLSVQLRQAWDSPRVQSVLTRSNPLQSTEAHIGVVGHITPEELGRELAGTDVANGFANRFLWARVKRSKLLPRGGKWPAALDDVARRLHNVLDWARTVGLMDRDGGYWELWDRVYPELSADRSGAFGLVTSRAEAQVTRLALIYALLDMSPLVTRAHLKAALAVWEFCQESAEALFDDRTGDPIADKIMVALLTTPEGLSRTELSALFGGHRTSLTIDGALRLIESSGLATMSRESTAGRPIERWVAVPKKRRKRSIGGGGSRPGSSSSASSARLDDDDLERWEGLATDPNGGAS